MKNALRPFKYSLINPVKEKIAIAPMVDVSNNMFRFFMRYLTKHCFLYTEMVNEHAIILNAPNAVGEAYSPILDFTKN